MKNVKPIYFKLLIVAIVIYIIGNAYMFSDLYVRYERLRHKLIVGHLHD